MRGGSLASGCTKRWFPSRDPNSRPLPSQAQPSRTLPCPPHPSRSLLCLLHPSSTLPCPPHPSRSQWCSSNCSRMQQLPQEGPLPKETSEEPTKPEPASCKHKGGQQDRYAAKLVGCMLHMHPTLIGTHCHRCQLYSQYCYCICVTVATVTIATVVGMSNVCCPCISAAAHSCCPNSQYKMTRLFAVLFWQSTIAPDIAMSKQQ